jgi:hypothetical protein
MTELFFKTKDTNTLADRRMSAMSKGQRLDALTVPMGGTGLPAMDAVGVSNLNLQGRRGLIDNAAMVNAIGNPVLQGPVGVRSMASGLDAPLEGLGGKTLREVILGKGLKMEGNSLLPDWKNLWDALRVDLTIRKLMRPTIRELIYNVQDTPNATRTMNITEMYPHATVFELNNGTGQSVRQMELMGGQYDTAIQKIYAAGLMVDLQAVLFGNHFTDLSVNDAVAIGEAGIKDELAMAPIFTHTYAAEAQTPVFAGAQVANMTRQELLYNTLNDGQDDLAKRKEASTGREIGGEGLVLVANPNDARHAAQVLKGGFPASNNSGNYMSLDNITKVVGYEPEVIIGETETVSYTACPTGKAYLIKPNRHMAVAVKRRLQLNVSMTPNPGALAQEEKAWWFCEAIHNTGIDTHIQEITLPAW